MSELSAQLTRIIDGLQQQFASSRVVWWEDPQGEFSETLDTLALENVQVLRRSVTPALAIAGARLSGVRVEIDDPAIAGDDGAR